MNRHSDWYEDRNEDEVLPLALRLYEALSWFFSDECARVNKEYYGPRSNSVAYINAYVDHAEGKHMVYDPVSNYKTGCSFWGYIRKEEWRAKSSGCAKIWCVNKAEEILHLI